MQTSVEDAGNHTDNAAYTEPALEGICCYCHVDNAQYNSQTWRACTATLVLQMSTTSGQKERAILAVGFGLGSYAGLQMFCEETDNAEYTILGEAATTIE